LRDNQAQEVVEWALMPTLALDYCWFEGEFLVENFIFKVVPTVFAGRKRICASSAKFRRSREGGNP
jgi:hypothetical protein